MNPMNHMLGWRVAEIQIEIQMLNSCNRLWFLYMLYSTIFKLYCMFLKSIYFHYFIHSNPVLHFHHKAANWCLGGFPSTSTVLKLSTIDSLSSSITCKYCMIFRHVLTLQVLVVNEWILHKVAIQCVQIQIHDDSLSRQ